MKLAYNIASILLGLLLAVVTTRAVDIRYAGSIDDGLAAPTSLDIRQDRLAVLEPFARQLKVFTTEGVIVHHVQLEGEAHSLQSLSETVYLFCDRNADRIVGVDISHSGQFDFLEGRQLLADPVDVLVIGNQVCVLDAGPKEILIFDDARRLAQRVRLVDGERRLIGFPSSFAHDPVRGRFYVLDQLTSRIWVVAEEGGFEGSFGSFGSGLGEITRGGEILCGADGLVYVSDRFQNRVVIFSGDGDFLANVDLADHETAGLYIPTGLAVDSDGLLYVASTEGAAIQVFFIENVAREESWALRQVYPAPFDTVAPEGVSMVAEAEVFGPPELVTGFDFELYTKGDYAAPLLSVADLDPIAQGGAESFETMVTARWIVQQALDENELFEWRARVRSGEIIGRWTDFRQFATSSLPLQFHLAQNYPNPFNPETHILFTVPVETDAELTIFNLLGQMVRAFRIENASPGEHEVVWDGRNETGRRASTGVYFYRLVAGENVQTRKMVLLK